MKKSQFFGVEFLRGILVDFGCEVKSEQNGRILSLFKIGLEFGWRVFLEQIWVFEFPNGLDERVFIYED